MVSVGLNLIIMKDGKHHESNHTPAPLYLVDCTFITDCLKYDLFNLRRNAQFDSRADE